MNKYSKLLSILLALLLVLGPISGIYAVNVVQNSNGKTIYVSKTGTDRNNGLTPETSKRNIKSAINSAQPGDTIQVAPGTYTENLVIDKNLTINGNNQENTIIDGHNTANCIRIYGANVNIQGFTLKNGVQGSTYDFGGGIYNHGGTITLENSTITDNNAKYGGGIYNMGTLSLNNVNIKNNRAQTSGGGIDNSIGTVNIENSTINDNTATELVGGGIYNVASMHIKKSTIKNNHAKEEGGGIKNNYWLIVEDSIVADNIARGIGGGICGPAYVYNTTITNNRASDGGGIYNSLSTYVDDLTVNLMKGNTPNNFAGPPYIPA